MFGSLAKSHSQVTKFRVKNESGSTFSNHLRFYWNIQREMSMFTPQVKPLVVSFIYCKSLKHSGNNKIAIIAI